MVGADGAPPDLGRALPGPRGDADGGRWGSGAGARFRALRPSFDVTSTPALMRCPPFALGAFGDAIRLSVVQGGATGP